MRTILQDEVREIVREIEDYNYVYQNNPLCLTYSKNKEIVFKLINPTLRQMYQIKSYIKGELGGI